MNLYPIYVKDDGRRIIVAESSVEPTFSIPKAIANKWRESISYSNKKKLFTLYEGKEFQILETLDWQSGTLFDDSGQNSSGNIFKHTK